jgi:CRISPR-associated endonuclease Cas1
MNALWLERITTYKNSPQALSTAKAIIDVKIQHQGLLLKKFNFSPHTCDLHTILDTQDLLLYEARAAKYFWRSYKDMLPIWTNFKSRKPRANDITNKVLDIGYHHLATKVARMLKAHDIPPAPALFHVAHQKEGTPLVYDLMELFRSDVVDAEVLKFTRLKKRPVEMIEQNDIRMFLARINRRLKRKHFLRDFKQCHTYHYYMELQLLKFIKAVNHKEVFKPMELPQRHDSRCPCKTINL